MSTWCARHSCCTRHQGMFLLIDTKLKKMFGNPKVYAKAIGQSWEAEKFRASQYDLSILPAATLHPVYAP